MTLPLDWQLDPQNKESKRLNEMLTAHARKLQTALSEVKTVEEKKQAIHAFYRKYYTLTLNKECIAAGINRSPARDFILDFPWKDLNQDRIVCLKIWEKINH
jgi:hypothetical protein